MIQQTGDDAQLGSSKKSAQHDFCNVMLIIHMKIPPILMIDYNQLSQMCSIVEPDVVITGNGNSYDCQRRLDFDATKSIL